MWPSRISGSIERLIRGLAAAIVFSIACSSAVAAEGTEAVTLRFDISRYEVTGNTLLKPEQVDAALAPFAGKQRDFGDIQHAVEALENAYRAAGYSAVQVYLPEQELERGVVTVKVVEARIKLVEIEGNNYYDMDNIRRSLPTLHEGISPNTKVISAEVGAANENPGKKINVTLRAGDEEGEVDAKVDVVDENPKKFFLTVDNTGNSQTGTWRTGIGYQNANIGNRDHALTLQYITAPEKSDQVSIYSVGYRLPLYELGDSMDFFAGYSDVNAGTSSTPAGPLAFTGKGKIAGARYNLILPRQGEYDHRVVFSADYRAFQNACAISGAAICGSSGADITVRPLGVSYAGQLARATSQTTFSAGVFHNFPGVGKGTGDDFQVARPGSNADYNVVRATLNQVNVYAGDWQSRVAVNGQYTPDALVSGEQFGLVGSTAVRGFLEREIASDKGYYANLEGYSPDFGPRLYDGTNLRGLVFYDAGRVWRNKPLPTEIPAASATSFGAGLRLSYKKNVSLRFDAARVMAASFTQRNGSVRAHLGLVVSF